ncbi:protein spire isoform X2 [Aricia agestis]|uniref:protein spire isoform X2 n=1 Tax=Aricia agestis TaxID=91739 RepID=UPI001C209C35|nr:protein spire isoform X2 [Aricia agestis]
MMRKDSAGAPGGTEVSLDAAECLTLQQILQAFNSNISEEHAWALFYQASRCYQKCLEEGNAYYLPTELEHVLIHKDGTVHPSTLLQTRGDSTREKVKSENELVVNLAMVVYHALDYTHGEDEERLISPDLEGLITEMTSGNIAEDDEECGVLSEESETSEGGRADTDDEGIERDSEPAPRRKRPVRLFMLKDVIERCVWHCGGGGGRLAREAAAGHYRAVCRALVAEALELASFLARVRVGGARDLGAAEDSATHLDTLQFSDWTNRRIWRALQARFWMQVIGELRMGVKLKKVNYSRTPIEYELTPYEILMDDIRSRRYTLRKVDGAMIPQSVKKDAHAMILEFIRSRPPLKKASERKLPPPRRDCTPRERLLKSIEAGRPLRRTQFTRTLTTSGGSVASETRRGEVTPHAPPQRRLIKVDFDNLEDDDDEDDTETCISPEPCAPQPFPRHSVSQQPAPKPWKRTAAEAPRAPPRTRITHHEYHQFCDETLESYDLATQCPSRRASMRRHTVTHAVCPTIDGAQSLPHSRPGSRASCAGATSIASSDADGALGELSWSRSSLQDELIKSKQWQDAIMSDDRLSLTLEEIVHIRSVLTKAELEVLPVEGRVKEDVEKRRVCFLCLKTRFGIFGPWGQKCKLCKKTVCQKCCSKMRIPTEHFAHVPVVLLSPSLLPSPDDEQNSTFPRSLMSRLLSPEHSGAVENTVGSAPNSPVPARRAPVASAPTSRGPSALGFVDRSQDGPGSMPCVTTPMSTLERRARLGRSVTGVAGACAAERLRGVQMAVCHDCKAMVLQIIKSSRASRSAIRDRALRHLTLDLAPVYTADC